MALTTPANEARPRDRIVITGVGLTAPNADNLPDFRQALLTGKSGVQWFETRHLGKVFAGVCHFDEFLYQKKKREKEIKSNTVKTVIKEIRFTAETGDHDLEFKVRHATEFLKEGSKVRAYVQFKGRGITFINRGELLLLKFIQALDDFGQPEALPKMEGKRMTVMLNPKKKGK